MSKERFTEILEKHGHSAADIDLMWDSRPTDDLDEKVIEEAARKVAAFRKAIMAKKGGSNGKGGVC